MIGEEELAEISAEFADNYKNFPWKHRERFHYIDQFLKNEKRNHDLGVKVFKSRRLRLDDILKFMDTQPSSILVESHERGLEKWKP